MSTMYRIYYDILLKIKVIRKKGKIIKVKYNTSYRAIDQMVSKGKLWLLFCLLLWLDIILKLRKKVRLKLNKLLNHLIK